MSKAFRLVPALGAVLFALVGLSACGGMPGDAVVQVNGRSITKTTFGHWMSVAASANAAAGSTAPAKPVVPEPPNYTACIAHLAATSPKPAKGQSAPTTAQLRTQCATQYKALSQTVLGALIQWEWIIGEAKSMGIKVTDAEVKKQFTTIKNQQFAKAGEFEKFLAGSGQTVSDILLRVKVNMIERKLQTKITKDAGKVTQAQIAKYYNENKSRFGTPEKRNVEIVLTKTEAQAKSAKKEIESGKSFASVAKRVSIDPVSKASGGLLKEVVKGQEEKALDAAIFSTAKNVLTGPVKTPFGFYVVEVQSTTPGSQQGLAQVQASIKQQLVSTQQQQAFSKFVKSFKSKWTAKTECRSGYTVAVCKGYKAPKTSSSTAPATPVP